MGKKEVIRSDDQTFYARNLARINPSLCSHRFKKDEKGETATTFCADCGTPLRRQKAR